MSSLVIELNQVVPCHQPCQPQMCKNDELDRLNTYDKKYLISQS